MPHQSTDSIHSSHREKLIEHIFIGDVLRELWRRDICDVEVLSSQVDAGGYDLVIESRGVLRHIQLKSSFSGAKTSQVKVGMRLAGKKSGCVVWILFDRKTMALGPFRWFGGKPGQAMPDISGMKIAKHSRGDAAGRKHERPNQRMIPKSRFEEIPTMELLVKKLFG